MKCQRAWARWHRQCNSSTRMPSPRDRHPDDNDQTTASPPDALRHRRRHRHRAHGHDDHRGRAARLLAAGDAVVAALPTTPATLRPPDMPAQQQGSAVHELFRRLAHRTAYAIGTPVAFIIAILSVTVWALSGPIFGFSDTWQLVINTSTTIITFLVVFMIQNTQNRDSQAIHLKLDELIRAMATARNALVDVEDQPDAELARWQREMHAVCRATKDPASDPQAPKP